MSYRQEFVKNFGELFTSDDAKSHCESHGVQSMYLDEENEVVLVTFIGGKIKKINVAGDSLSAIAYDIIQYGLW